MTPERSSHWPLMPPAPGDEEDDEPPRLRTSFLVITVVLGAGVTPILPIPFGLLVLAGALGLLAGIVWHLGGRIGATIAILLVTSLSANFLRPALTRSEGFLTASLLALLPGMAVFAAVLLVMQAVEARSERQSMS